MTNPGKSSKNIIQRQNIASVLTAKVRERILNGEFAGGALLRQETLAEEYGVSRMPVREALRNLETEGLVIVQPGKGALVSQLSLAEISEIFDLRSLLEVDTLRAGVPKMDKQSLTISKALLDELDLAYRNQDVRQWGLLNARFHFSLYEPSGRTIALSIITKLNHLVDRYVRLQLVLDQDTLKGSQEHKELYSLCRAGDADAAATLLKQHIDDTKGKLMNNLSAKKSSLPISPSENARPPIHVGLGQMH